MDHPSRPDPGARGRDPDTARQIWPLLVGYWAFGQFWGVWVILVYEFQQAHGIADARLGLLYASLSVVAILVMLMVAPRLQPLSMSATTSISLASLGIGAFAIGYLPTGAILLGFMLVGVGNGLIDVFLNVAAQRVEVDTRKPVLQWIHAGYALGGLAGALVAGIVITTGHDYRLGLAYSGLCLFATATWNRRTAPKERRREGPQTMLSVSAFRRSPVLWIPALVVLFAFLIEGSMDTWSGLYLRDQLGATAGAAAIAFAAFAGAVFLGRMFAGKVLFGLGPRKTIIVAGIGSLAGALIAALAHSAVVAGLAFLLLGFALSSAGPAGFGLVEASDEDPVHAIAAVTTVGYTGFIWSPPLLGWVAQTFSLRATMAVVVIATIGLIGAGLIAPHTAEG